MKNKKISGISVKTITVIAFLLIAIISISTLSIFSKAQQSGTVQAEVGATVSISLLANTVNFGSLTSNAHADTDNNDGTYPNPNSALPFRLTNDGNTNVDVTVEKTQRLFTGAAQSDELEFKVNNDATSGECTITAGVGSCWNTGTGQITYASIPTTPSTASVATRFEFQNSDDAIEVEIHVHVPSDEPASGSPLSTTVTFKATQSI